MSISRACIAAPGGAFFVTRAKRNLNCKRRYSRPVDRSTGLLSDQTIILRCTSKVGYPDPLRRIRFKTPKATWCS